MKKQNSFRFFVQRILLPWLALQVTTAFAQINSRAQSFEDIFAASINAMGGEKELGKIQSITALATCTGPRGNYTTEVYSMRGDRLMFKQVTSTGEVFLGYVNGEVAWTKNQTTAHVSAIDKSYTSMLRGHEFQMMAIILPERYKNPVVEGEEYFAGKRCIKIRMIDQLDSPCQAYFDTSSRLLAGLVFVDPRPDTVRIVFNEWKRINKVMLPAKVTATDKSGDWILDFQDIILNRVDENIFEIPPSISAVKELLQLQQQERAAHFGKNAKLLVSVFADDFINIGAGKITRPTLEESRNRLQAYFDRSEFLEWDDMSPPIIRVSQDASMAYVIVHKRVRRKAKNEQGETEEESTDFAWLETYEKRADQWMLTAVASTNKPPSK